MSPQFGMIELEVRFDFWHSLGPPYLFGGRSAAGAHVPNSGW